MYTWGSPTSKFNKFQYWRKEGEREKRKGKKEGEKRGGKKEERKRKERGKKEERKRKERGKKEERKRKEEEREIYLAGQRQSCSTSAEARGAREARRKKVSGALRSARVRRVYWGRAVLKKEININRSIKGNT
jgi:hypothetical protein